MIKKKIKNFYESLLFEKAVGFSVVFLIYKFLFPIQETPVSIIINESLAIHILYFWMKYLPGKIAVSRKTIPKIYQNIFFQTILLFFLSLIFLNFIPNSKFYDAGFLREVGLLFISSIFLVLIIYIYAGFTKLFFYKQKPNAVSYFRVMVIFTLIIGVMNAFDPFVNSAAETGEGFFNVLSLGDLIGWKNDFENIFQIALIIILVVNAFRVSWIAILNKKQKKTLAGLSFILAIVFIVLVVMFFENGKITKTAYLFSPTIFITSVTVLLYGAVYSTVVFFTAVFHIPTAEETDRATAEYSSLLEFGRMMSRIWDFEDLAVTILKLSQKISNADSVWLAIKNDDFELYTLGVGEKNAASFTRKFLKENKVNSAVVVRGISLSRDNHFKETLISPIKIKGKHTGYLFSAFKNSEETDEDLMRTISGLMDYVALAIENSELAKKSIENERMEKELELAREIQMKIIPDRLPAVEGIKVEARFIPAFEVGGDYYDFFNLGGKKIFVIADVSGKGMEASYIMAEMKGVLETLSAVSRDLREMIIKANEIFVKRLSKKHFITAVFGEIDNETGIVKYFRLGQNFPLLLRNNGAEYLQSAGLGLGITASDKFLENLEEVTANLSENKRIIFYTDGVPEAKNDKDEEFGYDKLSEIADATAEKSMDEVMEQIITEISLYSQKKMQSDDITILMFEKK